MRRVSRILLLVAVAVAVVSPAEARRASRSCLLVNLGAGGLTGEVSGDVVNDRVTPRLDLGVGFQVHDQALVEFTYGWSGTWSSDVPVGPLLPDEYGLPDAERVFEVGTNPIMARFRYARSGIRTEYLKPEFSAGLGFMQVTSFLRNPPGVPPQEKSEMLFAVELGAAALFVFSRNFAGSVGLRYTITQRSPIVGGLDHMDSIAFIVNFRGFLPSPRDVAEP